MYGAAADVDVQVVERDKRIVKEWPYGPKAKRTTVEWSFLAPADNTTFVKVINYGFSGTPEEVCE